MSTELSTEERLLAGVERLTDITMTKAVRKPSLDRVSVFNLSYVKVTAGNDIQTLARLN
jgi:hypothetical protein